MTKHDGFNDAPTETITNTTKSSLWDFLDRLLTDWRRLLFLGITLLFLTGILVLAVWGILRVAAWNRLEIMQTESGGIVYKVGPEETLSFLLSASAPWASTKFFVRRGDHLHITASGRVSLAIHHLVESAHSDTRPLHGWVGPDGLPENRKHLLFEPQDLWREQYLLVPKKPYGALVAAITPSDHPPGSEDTVFLVRREWEGEAPASGVLWFAVNDVILGPDRELAYNIPAEHKSATYSVPRTFEEIVADQYWNLWYDDNVGSFLVIVRRKN